MRRFATVAVSMLVLGALLAVPAAAQSPVQTTFKASAKVVPNDAGTPKNPKGVKIYASASFSTPEGFEKPVVTRAYALFPRHGDWNGSDYPKCTERILERDGEQACPKRSKIGHADASAYADTVITRPKIEIYNGGQNLALAFVTLYNPAFVQEAVPVRIQLLSHPKWKYKASFKVPETLQVVAGIPIAARSIKGWVGREKIITTTSCPPSRRWPYETRAYLSTGGYLEHKSSVPCRP